MRRMWMWVGAVLALAVGVVVWAVLAHGNPTADSTAFDDVKNRRLRANALLESGLTHFRHQEIAQAQTAFEHVLVLDPENKVAWFNLGSLAQGRGHRADALQSYDAALKADPSYTSALFNKALLLETSDPDAALALLRRAVAADPKASTAYFHIGQVLARQSRDAPARDAYRRAVALDPSLRPHVPEPFREPGGPSASGESTDENTGESTAANPDESTGESTAANTDESTGESTGASTEAVAPHETSDR
ncbi:tetratricopeptide repeat protein [Streptomyces sp. NPDC057638]|uniref:tetratricopeptide repeat protein n=1 Tax=Streptomyces sp. NPDC057638 TaxID=3346190 RepID=UPI0036A181AA